MFVSIVSYQNDLNKKKDNNSRGLANHSKQIDNSLSGEHDGHSRSFWHFVCWLIED